MSLPLLTLVDVYSEIFYEITTFYFEFIYAVNSIAVDVVFLVFKMFENKLAIFIMFCLCVET